MAFSLLIAFAALLSPTAPAPPTAPSRFVFEEVVDIGAPEAVGRTPLGERFRIPITGGRISGPSLSGTVRPGSADWQLKRADGSVQVDADYMIDTDDHVAIHVHNVGILMGDASQPGSYRWTSAQFEAPLGRYGSLNDAVFVSQINVTTDAGRPAVRVSLYRIGD